MATTIRVKRRTKEGNDDVKLYGGEPYYNLHDKKLYIGNSTSDNTPEELSDEKHIAQITRLDTEDDDVVFSVGGASDNQYKKTVNNVSVARGLVLDDANYGTKDDMARIDSPKQGQVFFVKAE